MTKTSPQMFPQPSEVPEEDDFLEELNPSDLAEIEGLMATHASSLEDTLKPSRDRLKQKIFSRIQPEELVTSARLSRMQSRFLLYTVKIVGLSLIAVLYLATLVSRVQIENKQKIQSTENELIALRIGLLKFQRSTQQIPDSGIGKLVKSLSQPITKRNSRDFLPLDADVKATRLKDGVLKDLWGRPYIYQRLDRSSSEGWTLYSLGPNGTDDGGKGDDIVTSLD